MISRIFESLGKLVSGGDSAPSKAARAGQRLVADGGVVFVVEEVRRGGMGIVYLCRFDSDKQERADRVALKTFDDRFFFDVGMSDTFQREHSLWTLVSDVPFVLPVLGIFFIKKKPHLPEEPPRIDLDSNRTDLKAARTLRALALRCLAKAPGDRPPDFASLAKEVTAAAFEHDPILALHILEAAAGLSHLTREEQPELANWHLHDLLRNNDVEAAVLLVRQLPEESLKGELLMTVGSVWSLAGDDEKALGYFDQFLAENPEPKRRWACLNELGLSLKRLRRFDEAKELYEHLLVQAVGNDELDLMVRSNYAGVLIENKETEKAIAELRRILRRHANEPQPLALMAWALQHAGRLDEGVTMIHRAVAADPRNGNYHVMRADMLLGLGQVHDALESVYRAYSLGFHSRQWLLLALATNMALDRKAEVAGILASAREQLPKEEIETVFREAIERLRQLANAEDAAEENAGKEESTLDRTSNAPASPPSKPAPASDPATPARPKTPEEQEAEAGAHHRAIHAGATAHVQLRMSSVDGSYAIDFYLRSEASDYVEQFRSGYAQIKERFPGDPAYNERQEQYRFVHCQNCGFDVLTARDEGERFVCQACGVRGPVVTVHSDRLDPLASGCEAAIGRKERDATDGGSTLCVGFWATKEDVARAVSQRMQAAGYRQAAPGCPAFLIFQQQMEKQKFEAEGPPSQIWYRALDREAGIRGETPRSLDALLRGLRREIGPFYSASMDFPDDFAQGLLANAGARLRILREDVAKDPDSDALKEALVVAELNAGNVDNAVRIAAAMEVASPGNPDAMLAAAHVAFSQGRHDDAIQRLERLLGMNERNQGARGLLILVYKAVGNEEKAWEHLRVFHALGGVPDLLLG